MKIFELLLVVLFLIISSCVPQSKTTLKTSNKNIPIMATAIAGDTQATISFSPPKAIIGSIITSYTVISNPGNITNTAVSSPITVSGLTNGLAYTFVVKSNSLDGSSAASATSNSIIPIQNFSIPVVPTPTPTPTLTLINLPNPTPTPTIIPIVTPVIVLTIPKAPTMGSVVGGNGQVSVNFTAPSSNGGAVITSYQVTSNPGNIMASGTQTPIVVSGLTNGVAYTFSVKAINSVGMSLSSLNSTSVIPAGVPTAPIIGIASAADSQASINFTIPTSNGGSPITSYTVTSSSGRTVVGTTSPIIMNSLLNGTTYTFTVKATNIVGTSIASANSNAIVPAVATLPVATSTTPQPFNIGMNFAGLSYYNNIAIYSDMAMAVSGNNGPWDSSVVNNTKAVLDITGNPTTAAWTAITSDYPTGNYDVSWDGTGNLSLNANGVPVTIGTVTSTVVNGVTHKTATLNLTRTRGGFFFIYASAAITNFHIIAPTSEIYQNSIFLKNIITKMKAFSTIRFMDSVYTNNNIVQNWSERTWPTMGSRSGTAQGMAYEDIIALANITGKNIWINIPVRATDDYVCRMARLFRYGEPGDKTNSTCSLNAPSSATVGAVAINPNLQVHIEFSNEVWNGGFNQTTDLYCMANGSPNLANQNCSITAPTSKTAIAAFLNPALKWSTSATKDSSDIRANQLTRLLEKRTSDIFKSVFADHAGQVKMMINIQSAWPQQAISGLDFIKASYGPLINYFDALAVAPYFDLGDGDTGSEVMSSSVANTIAALKYGTLKYNSSVLKSPNLSVALSDFPSSFTAANSYFNPNYYGNGMLVANWIKNDLDVANSYGLPLVAYEGGQGLSGNVINSQAKMTVQSDPAMYDLYRQYYDLWDKIVGRKQLFVHFSFAGSPSKYGSWGSLENAGDAGSQKWDAMMSMMLLPGDANMDGIVDQSDCTIILSNINKTGMWWSNGDFNHDGIVNALDIDLFNQSSLKSGLKCMP